MKLLGICVAITLVAGVAAAPHAARAQALGEAATLGAGVSSAGSGSASALGSSLGRAMASEGSRMGSSGKTSTSGGVITLHYSRQELERDRRTARTRAKNKARTGSKKAQPDFVIFGADPPDSDTDAAPASQPKPATNKGPKAEDDGKK